MSEPTVMYALLALALGVGAGLVVLVIGELRWEARNRLPRCTTCGEHHHRHAAHR
ncbi:MULTISPECIES: hypothetical protein [Streptomyces]|uniref:Uncharacterized protein n=1 Tax=Streptomyces djakartensis TaxID=68193 RepID=A0ABQ2ZEG3_9ACTN|nr:MULTISPECIES: hypothetical protein [Streptomyces]MDX2878446.1 hypothetical protein [Streptomyces ipomoeae]GGY12967.1 hypothetical protein GCM10010384_18210 [Streptomyces djakartensis]